MFPHLGFGVVTLAVCAFCLAAGNDYCHTKDAVQIIQKTCKQEQENLSEAEGGTNYTEVCIHFPLVMICAVTALPQCYNYIESIFSMYGHSPFSCSLSPEVIKELQAIVHKGTQVTVLTTSTTTDTTTSAVHEEHSDVTFLTSTSSSFTQKEIVVPGNNEKQQGVTTRGDGSIVMSNISTMVLLLVATLLLRRLTS